MKSASSHKVFYYDTVLPTTTIFEADDNHAMTLKTPTPPVLAIFWADALLRLQRIVTFGTHIVITRLSARN
jgi:hypothetical protein